MACAWMMAAVLLGAAGSPANRITNGGFEEGLVGWAADPQHQRVVDPRQAHSGRACLLGEVTGPRQALRLKRRIPVQAGNRYELQLWARGDRGTKVVLWATPPGAGQRRAFATWDKLTPRWRLCRASFSFAESGVLELEIIAPSSHNASPGRVWIDDVALYETVMPPVVLISGDGGFNDEPAMAAAADGSVYVAYNSFRNGADSLRIVRCRRGPEGWAVADRWTVVEGPGTYLLGIRAVAAGRRAAVVYAAERAKNWDIYLVWCGPEGPSEPSRITTSPAVDVKPAAAWRDGVLWIVWESNRNTVRQIFAAAVRGGEPPSPEAVSAPDGSSYDPAVACSPEGTVHVGWHAFRDGNYDIYWRRRSGGGRWGAVRRLTRAPGIDRHAVLAEHNGQLWLIYEHAQTETYHIGRTNRRRLIAARVDQGRLVVPASDAPDSPLAARCEGAAAAWDNQGRLWLALLKPRLPRSGWDTYLTRLEPGGWRRPAPVSLLKGMDRPPSVAVAGDEVLVAFQSDTTPNSWSDLDQMAQAASHIYLASVAAPPGLDGEPPAAWKPLQEPAEPFEPAALRIERGEELPTPSITYQGQTLHLYFGDLHEHTDVSICNRLGDQSVDESYQHMRDLARYDFACATDHGYNINSYIWSYLAKQARANDDPGRFLTFLAEEWTSTFEEYSEAHPYGFYGHRNLIFADPYFPRWWNARNRQTPAEVWEDLRRMNADFVHIPHQLADTGNVPTDWNFHDDTAQPVAEIFQTRGSYEYKGAPREAARATPQAGYFLQDAWARGIVIGVIAAPDHGGGYGKACVYAPELTREAVLEAIRARHCYGTTAAKIVLDVRVNGRLMGETIPEPAGQTVRVQIRAACPGDIERIDVCRNNEFIYTATPPGKRAELTMVDQKPLPGRSYYYVRVIQKDQEIAWSSPVWFGTGSGR